MSSKRTMTGWRRALLAAVLLALLAVGGASATPHPWAVSGFHTVTADGPSSTSPSLGPHPDQGVTLIELGNQQGGRLQRARSLIVCAVGLGIIGVILGAAALFRRD